MRRNQTLLAVRRPGRSTGSRNSPAAPGASAAGPEGDPGPYRGVRTRSLRRAPLGRLRWIRSDRQYGLGGLVGRPPDLGQRLGAGVDQPHPGLLLPRVTAGRT